MYCPLLLNGCLTDKVNPYARLSAKRRLQLQIYLEAALKVNHSLLKEWSEQNPITVRDENDATYTGAFVPRKRTQYRLDSTLPIVQAWDRSHPDDQLGPRLLIGASELNELAKAKVKRLGLEDVLSTIAEVIPYSEFQISVELSQVGTKKRKIAKQTM